MRNKDDINKDIELLKNKIGSNAREIIESGLNLKRKGSLYHCPNGYKHKNGDRTPSLSWNPRANHFYCFGCQETIDIYDYYREYLNYNHYEILAENNIEVDNQESIINRRTNFSTETSKITSLTDDCRDYIKLRGIIDTTITKFDLATYKNDIAFKYFKKGTLVGVKTRIPRKAINELKGKSIKGSKPFLFNTQNINFENGEIIVCEGEFDCMIISQCGYENVVSVGAGGNSLRSLFENSTYFFYNFENIILVSDNDETGTNMEKQFTDQFKDKVKLIDKRLYSKNDINEEFVLHGKESILKIIESAKIKIEGIRDLEEKPYTGIEDTNRKYIPTGIKSIDGALNDLGTGMVTLLTGRTNAGKTTFCTQIKANAIDKGFKVFEISGEGLQDIMLNKFYQSIIGRNDKAFNIKKINKKFIKEPKKEILQALRKWHYKKLKMFTKGDSKLKNTKELFKIMSNEVKSNKHDLIIIDNLMSILSVSNSIEKNNQQADFVQRCCDFSKIYNVHIILVLHPNKNSKKGESIEIEHLSGTADMGNKADNILNVIRKYDDADVNDENISAWIEVSKNRYYSQLPKTPVKFNFEKEVFEEILDGSILTSNINWEKYLNSDVNLKTLDKIETTNKHDECPM